MRLASSSLAMPCRHLPCPRLPCPSPPRPPCRSHWFQMYSTLAMGATTHKVCWSGLVHCCRRRSSCGFSSPRMTIDCQPSSEAPAGVPRLPCLPARAPPPPHPTAGHQQPQLCGARLLPLPPIHGLLLHLLRSAVPHALPPQMAAVHQASAAPARGPGPAAAARRCDLCTGAAPAAAAADTAADTCACWAMQLCARTPCLHSAKPLLTTRSHLHAAPHALQGCTCRPASPRRR